MEYYLTFKNISKVAIILFIQITLLVNGLSQKNDLEYSTFTTFRLSQIFFNIEGAKLFDSYNVEYKAQSIISPSLGLGLDIQVKKYDKLSIHLLPGLHFDRYRFAIKDESKKIKIDRMNLNLGFHLEALIFKSQEKKKKKKKKKKNINDLFLLIGSNIGYNVKSRYLDENMKMLENNFSKYSFDIIYGLGNSFGDFTFACYLSKSLNDFFIEYENSHRINSLNFTSFYLF